MFPRNDYFIEDAIDSWIDLYNVNAANQKRTSEIAVDTNIIKQPVSLTANLLHPKYRSLKWNLQEFATVNEFLLDKLDEDRLNQLTAHKKRSDIFAKLFQKEIKSPLVFQSLAET